MAFSGMQASIARLSASASNIANANSKGPIPSSSMPAPGGPQVYQPVRVVAAPVAGGGTYTRVVAQTPGYRTVSDPTSPYANASGMVAAPDVDIASELVEQIAARIAFSANLSVFKATSDMKGRLLDRFA